MATPAAQEKYAKRKSVGERPFATIKQQFGMRQFLTRGLDHVQNEWLWAAADNASFGASRNDDGGTSPGGH
jgi:hypothetical protein